ncbi:hypothetical protein BDZ94DRAFT_1250004 [Collybia nuda]|uniref:Uncharacterized protein n=1 Tax=Collybia nuda TaxID=64659 RepID=A0A9P5YB38_9AGAR|nr:hypothetical protein BDZ94DRAFT_1250004 [Collybia nuda]
MFSIYSHAFRPSLTSFYRHTYHVPFLFFLSFAEYIWLFCLRCNNMVHIHGTLDICTRQNGEPGDKYFILMG